MSNNKPLILQTRKKIEFDVNNPEHRTAYYKFRRQGKWGAQGCPFDAIWPHTNVPAMCETQIFEYLAEQDLVEQGITVETINVVPNVKYARQTNV